MLVHSYYEEDPRVRREAEALVAAGRPVDVYALRRAGDDPVATVDGVRLVRLDVQRHQGAGMRTYVAEYAAFFGRAAAALARAHRRRQYALVQAHSLPDALVFAGLPVRLAGVPLVLDLHEAMPEFFRIRFPGSANRLARAILRGQERASIAAARAVITVNEALADRLVGLGVPPAKVTVIANSPSLARFDAGLYERRPFMADGRLRLVYAGALSPVYELDVALDAVSRVATERPGLDVAIDLYGRDFGEVDLAGLAARHGIADRVTLRGRIPIEAVPAALAAADIGLAPTRRSAFTDFSLSTKLFEYAAMDKPVVASRLPLVERTFPAGTVATYVPGDAASLAAAIVGLVDDPADREMRVAATTAIVRERAWEREAARYLALVERMAVDGLSSPASRSAATGRAPDEQGSTR
jgi:glycosyltransferase involved in cell wall biosynthesis